MTTLSTRPGPRVVIGACTFRRQEDLQDLIKSLAMLRNTFGAHIEVVIVDNDVTPSARNVVAKAADALPFPCRYVHEPVAGIPNARNRVIDESGDADFLLFVDDDETVHPDLLDEHLRMQQNTQAQFVQGPCVMTVPDEKLSWWLDTTFFSQDRFVDGAERAESWTNNVLIDLAFLRKSGVRFELALRYAGGSDTVFFQDLVSKGAKGVFAVKAVVYEKQPFSRLNWRWAVRRQFRYGVTRANSFILRRSRLAAFGQCFMRSGAMIGLGFGKLVIGVFRGRRGLADGLALIARGCGVAMGFIGFKADEYKRVET